VTISPFNKIEIVFLYKPYDIQFPFSDISDLKIHLIEKDINDEFLNPITNPEVLKIYILTPQQYFKNIDKIKRHYNSATNAKHSGFILVENPRDLPTILLRKKVSNIYKNINVLGNLRSPISRNQFFYEIRNSIYSLFLNSSYEYLESFSFLRELESRAMKDISKAMTNKSFYAKDFLDLVLKKSMEITIADAGFILIKEDIFAEPPNPKEMNKIQILNKPLKFIQKSKILNSQKIFLKRNTLDPNHSKITKSMIENKSGVSWFDDNINLPNKEKIIALKKSSPLPEIDFDAKTYKIKSYCAFPIHLPSGEIEGFIILINKRISEDNILTKHSDIDNYVSKFSSHDLNLLESFTNQAGIALEHSKLISDLKKVFESFTAASIIAIESRDPTTKGHSERVATLTVGLAEAINNTKNGVYSSLEFSKIQVEEIRYASLLHDFGKIGVREHILNKEKKLFPFELEKIQSRFLMLQDKLHINILEKYISSLMEKKEIPKQEDFEKHKLEILNISNKFTKYFDVILDVNEPALLSQEFFDKISEIAATKIIVGDNSYSLLSEKEIEILSIKKGSLSQAERLEIESHVTHSYNFLIQIPWSSELRDIPEIVYGHHERLDGSGYPRSLKGKNIPVQAKMMAITDIFDALVAQDRPYKKAIPYDRALNILEAEVKHGKLDGDLFKIFVEAKVGQLILNQNSDDQNKLYSAG
jgi:HD-GYP domain-containing protein (c-di-GMP phosphodiesterase class II)